MFRDTRRKKLRSRIVFATLGAFILAFGIWLNYQSTTDSNQAENVVKKVEVGEKKQTEEKKDNKNNKVNKENKKAGTDTEIQPETYLIKEVDGVVKVFLCDTKGHKELYLITTIPFDLLSESDQQLFVDGVTMETEEDLGKFLENFDS